MIPVVECLMQLACLNVWLPYDEYVKKYGGPSKNKFIKKDDGEIVLYGSLEKITKTKKGVYWM